MRFISSFLLLSLLLNFLVFFGVSYQKEAVQSNELTPYFKFFKDSAAFYKIKINTNNLILDYVDRYPKKEWVALCQRATNTKFVTILKKHFQEAPIEEKYSLVIHELGHCLLNLNHKDGYLPDGCPISIMHPSDTMFGCFFRKQDYYFKELFNKL
jgi:hypothetical protein